MNEWELREQEQLERENAYTKQFTGFQRLVDNHWTYLLLVFLAMIVGFGIGLGIGVLL